MKNVLNWVVLAWEKFAYKVNHKGFSKGQYACGKTNWHKDQLPTGLVIGSAEAYSEPSLTSKMQLLVID